MKETNTAHVVRLHTVGGRLQIDEVPLPMPAKGEVRLRVRALGINRVEELFWKGNYFIQPVVPSKVGVEASGVVEAVGPDVDSSWIGKSVGTVPAFDMTVYGVAGDTAIVPADVLAEFPERLSFEQGASIWMSYLSAYGALIQNRQFSKGDFVLLTAASSSMGLAAIQLVKAEGGAVIATTRTQAKTQQLLDLGADYVVVMNDEDIVARVKEITGGIGARLVLDPVAGKGLPSLAQATATSGTIIVAGYLGADMFGYVDGQPTPFPFIDVVGRNLNVRGYNGADARPRSRRGRQALHLQPLCEERRDTKDRQGVSAVRHRGRLAISQQQRPDRKNRRGRSPRNSTAVEGRRSWKDESGDYRNRADGKRVRSRLCEKDCSRSLHTGLAPGQRLGGGYELKYDNGTSAAEQLAPRPHGTCRHSLHLHFLSVGPRSGKGRETDGIHLRGRRQGALGGDRSCRGDRFRRR
jgi:NADPH:quinone reductase-like Zn-dependent oxidoreductase